MSDTDTEAGAPTVWDNGWREGHAHGVASALGISYRDGWQRTVRMLAGEKLDTSRPVSGNQVQNKHGDWVPAIPLPLFSWFPLLPRYRCGTCQAAYWTVKGYEGHYARDHILEAA